MFPIFPAIFGKIWTIVGKATRHPVQATEVALVNRVAMGRITIVEYPPMPTLSLFLLHALQQRRATAGADSKVRDDPARVIR